jgi:hypothetical protein
MLGLSAIRFKLTLVLGSKPLGNFELFGIGFSLSALE